MWAITRFSESCCWANYTKLCLDFLIFQMFPGWILETQADFLVTLWVLLTDHQFNITLELAGTDSNNWSGESFYRAGADVQADEWEWKHHRLKLLFYSEKETWCCFNLQFILLLCCMILTTAVNRWPWKQSNEHPLLSGELRDDRLLVFSLCVALLSASVSTGNTSVFVVQASSC